MYKEMIEPLYQEKDGRPVIGSILNCSKTIEPADIELRGTKRTRNQTKNVLIDRIEHEYLFYCSNLVVNGCFLICNPHKYHL